MGYLVRSEHRLQAGNGLYFGSNLGGGTEGSAFQLGWRARLPDYSTEYLSSGDFPAAESWLQLETCMSSHFIIFRHLGARVFVLVDCSWLAVNPQLLFSWNTTTKTVGQYDRKPNWRPNFKSPGLVNDQCSHSLLRPGETHSFRRKPTRETWNPSRSRLAQQTSVLPSDDSRSNTYHSLGRLPVFPAVQGSPIGKLNSK